MKFTKIPTTTFQELQLNAGILASEFDHATGTLTDTDILGATTGGVTATAVPSYTDFGEDIDNCPKNVKELKVLEGWECKISGTFLTVTGTLAKLALGAADISGEKITPRRDLSAADFGDVWFIGDYSDKNGATNGGFIAVHLLNALSTGGFSLKTSDKGKGQFAVEFTGHVSNSAQDIVPFEVYIHEGTAESGDYIMTFTSAAGTAVGETAISNLSTTKGAGEAYVYQTGYDLHVPDPGTVLTGSAWASWDGTADISVTTGMEIVIAIKDSDNKATHAGKGNATAREV
jgi:hypothetical protein